MESVRAGGDPGEPHGDGADRRARARLIHEALEDPERGLGYALEEVVVESVAYVACASAGLDISCEAVPYIAHYGVEEVLEALERSARVIDATARRIEEALDVEGQKANEAA